MFLSLAKLSRFLTEVLDEDAGKRPYDTSLASVDLEVLSGNLNQKYSDEVFPPFLVEGSHQFLLLREA